MAYCRWTAEGEESDVYVFQCVTGFWTIVVAEARCSSLELPVEPIGLPYDGVTFNLKTPGKCAKKLLELRGVGYAVPERAIQRLQEEQRDFSKKDRKDCRKARRRSAALRSTPPS